MSRKPFSAKEARKKIGFGVAVGLAIPTGCLWIGMDRYGRGTALLERGVRTTGTVVATPRLHPAIEVDVEYLVGSRLIFSHVNVRPEWRRRIEVGTKVPVCYLSENPTVSAMDPVRLQANGTMLILGAVPFGLFFGGLFVALGRFELIRLGRRHP